MAMETAELQEKLARLERVRREHDLDAVLLSRNENIAWATGGARGHIVLSQESGVGALLYDGQGLRLLTNNIEEGRLLGEELPAGDWRAIAVPWYTDWLREALLGAGAQRLGADIPLAGALDCTEAIAALRVPLLPAELERYRALGLATGRALEAAARAVRPGESEFGIAARIAALLIEQAIDPVVLLVAVDERISTIRHPLPTGKTVSERAMLVCCGRRYGLVASATRLIQFGPLPESLRLRHVACAQVDAAFLAATVPGATAAEIFAAGAAAYDAEGYDGEWRFHHQGGAAGYAPREWLATPEGRQVATLSQAFAWNPSIAGTKVEDTVLLTGDGLELITATGDWPTVEARAGRQVFARPAILELAAR